ncbi:CHAT domain-containing protein [Cohaesibacter gelatinilyticus]|uniref:CHAT domain-containing protein n=1 Tax=Cohaesibacter gelatinilyticus TaxID=372072 RepID=A0A285PFN8_9HYPH|nr:CHAT domain-containing protein [Cohaesibacter gelatinilyticus]SNZ20103.1 CHAT domain-containing protein [Cohaesibacter gelatinilyticus]
MNEKGQETDIEFKQLEDELDQISQIESLVSSGELEPQNLQNILIDHFKLCSSTFEKCMKLGNANDGKIAVWSYALAEKVAQQGFIFLTPDWTMAEAIMLRNSAVAQAASSNLTNDIGGLLNAMKIVEGLFSRSEFGQDSTLFLDAGKLALVIGQKTKQLGYLFLSEGYLRQGIDIATIQLNSDRSERSADIFVKFNQFSGSLYRELHEFIKSENYQDLSCWYGKNSILAFPEAVSINCKIECARSLIQTHSINDNRIAFSLLYDCLQYLDREPVKVGTLVLQNLIDCCTNLGRESGRYIQEIDILRMICNLQTRYLAENEVDSALIQLEELKLELFARNQEIISISENWKEIYDRSQRFWRKYLTDHELFSLGDFSLLNIAAELNMVDEVSSDNALVDLIGNVEKVLFRAFFTREIDELVRSYSSLPDQLICQLRQRLTLEETLLVFDLLRQPNAKLRTIILGLSQRENTDPEISSLIREMFQIEDGLIVADDTPSAFERLRLQHSKYIEVRSSIGNKLDVRRAEIDELICGENHSSLPELLDEADQNLCLVSATEKGVIIHIVGAFGQKNFLFDEVKLEDLVCISNDWLQEFKRYELAIERDQLKTEHLVRWNEFIDRFLDRLWSKLCAFINEALINTSLRPDARIGLLLPSYLYNLPILAARSDTGTHFFEKWNLCLFPSIWSAKQVLLRKVSRTEQSPKNVTVIFDPLNDFPFEQRNFGEPTGAGDPKLNVDLLYGGEATKRKVLSSLENADAVAFYCHGYYHHRFSQFSSLQLSDEDNPTNSSHLSVRELQDEKFKNLRLVLLGACGQGLVGNRYGNNFESVAVSFLESEANAAIAPLWSVLSQPTVGLGTKIMAKFVETGSAYETYRHAIKEAAYNGFETGQNDLPLARAKTSPDETNEGGPTDLPINAPIFWAGLTLWGC